MNELQEALKRSLAKAGLWKSGGTLLCALSGGGDSVALCRTLCDLREEGGYRLWACFVQHGLRGENSRQDQSFVEALCREWNVPLQTRDAGLSGDMNAPGVETLARERRRALFRECMEETAADAVLTAHHQDDQAETVLMHLLRGAGGKGLCGVPESAPFGRGLLLRPFLSLPKAALERFLREEGIPFRHDESNDLCCTPRNVLRLRTLPQMEEMFPGASRRLAQTAETLRQDEECLEELASALYRRCLFQARGIFALETAPLVSAPAALRLRALRRFYREGLEAAAIRSDEKDLSREETLALSALTEGDCGGRRNLPRDLQALRGRELLHLLRQNGEPLAAAPRPAPRALAPEASGLIWGDRRFVLRPPADPPHPLPGDASRVLLTEEELSACVLRGPEAGDWFHPFGAPGGKPLRRYLTDRKLDEPLRRALCILARGGQTLWIPGMAAAESLRRERPGPYWSLCCENPFMKDDKE